MSREGEGIVAEGRYVNVAFLGACKAGKSTLVGRLAYGKDEIVPEDRNLVEISDYTKDEKDAGCSLMPSYIPFLNGCSNYDFIMIDAPGRKSSLKEAGRAVLQSQIICVVISAIPGEAEESLIPHEGQLWNHLILAMAYGIKKVIFCINKMSDDSVFYSFARYKEIRGMMTPLAKKMGFKEQNTSFLAIDALSGDNVIQKSTKMPWNTSTLLKAFESITIPPLDNKSPFLMTIQEKYTIKGCGTVASGTILQGSIRPRDSIVLIKMGSRCADKKSPDVIKLIAKSLEVRCVPVEQAMAGTFVSICLSYHTHLRTFRHGDVLVCTSQSLPEVNSFTALFLAIGVGPKGFSSWYKPVYGFSTRRTPCDIKMIVKKIDKKTKKTIEDYPRTVNKGDLVELLCSPMFPLCVGEITLNQVFGTFIVYDHNKIIGIGKIQSISSAGPLFTPTKQQERTMRSNHSTPLIKSAY